MATFGITVGACFPNLNGFKTVTKHPVCSVSRKGVGATGTILVTGSIGSCSSRRRSCIYRLSSSSSKIMASATTETEKLGIKIVKNPPESKLSELGVRSWPKWGCPPSKFPWTYSSRETCYLLEGKVKVYPDGSDEAVEIVAGDLVVFPNGMSCTWDVSEAVDKHYKFD
ncbi:hypothetical protein Salat_2760100 [Sesamum alatum]|uniref:(S)-ureidoglycine aminohydrolase cupin domain-containing protein n=1 Tax=Sesamum alatum TaxID=300844 RepID=A0AAE1XK81_9LAMI|nr:hypothetical protein Salat_2760100 [Sesamum alatum]